MRYPRRVVERVEHYRALLLPGWRVELQDELPEYAADDPPDALISWADHLFVCRLWLSREVVEGADSSLNATIVHELMHPLFRELRTEFMPDEEDDPAGHARWEHHEEMLVERVALAFGDSGHATTKVA